MSAQVRDTLNVTIVFDSWRTHESGALYHNCGTRVIGVHDDPIGRGVGEGGYSYSPSIATQNTAEGAPQDIPGVQVAVTISGGSSASSPGDWPDCGSIAARVRAAWASAEVTATYTVPDNQPVAHFEWEQTDSLTVRLDGTESHVTSPSGPMPVASYDWSHGDNPSSAITEYTFLSTGDHDVSLTVTNDDGDEDTITRTVTITPYRLTVTPEIIDPKDLYSEGDTLIVEMTVENTGEESVFNVVVPHFTEMLSEGADLPSGATLPRQAGASRTAMPDPEEATVLEEGDTIVFRDTLVIDQHAHYRLDGEWIHTQVEAWAEFLGEIEAESLDPDNLPVKIIHPCIDGACGTFTVGPELHRVEGLWSRTVDNLNYARAGALPGPTLESVSFAQFDPDGNGGLLPQCLSGCIEIEAPIVKEDGSPAEAGVIAKIEVRYLGVKPQDNSFGGDFLCERVSVDESADCISEPGADNILEVETGDDGVARAWYAIPGALEEDGTLAIAASVKGLLYEDTNESSTADIALEALFDRTITLSASASIFGRMILALNTGAANISLGEWCAAAVNYIVDNDTPIAKARWKRNVAKYYFTNAANWACGDLVGLLGKEGSMLAALQTVADGTVIFTDLAFYTWFAQAFQIDKASDLVTAVTTPPPFLVRLDGDLLGFVKDDLAELTTAWETAPQTGNNLVLKEATGIVPMGTGRVRESHYRPQYNNGALRVELTTPRGEAETTISYGYVPVAAAFSVGSDGFLVENEDTFSGTQAATSPGDDEIAVEDWEGEPGDYVYLNDGGDNAETLQVIDTQPAPSANPTATGKTSSGLILQLASPVQFNYPIGSSVSWAGEGTVAPPDAPWLGVVLGPAAPDTLRWVDGGASTATSFDFQLANDSLFTDIILSVEDTAAYEVDVSAIPFVDFERYFWRVRATNLVGTGEWSVPDAFTPGTTILPVELTDFTATIDGDAVQLNWATASEENNAGFEVELRSADAQTFETVAFVPGNGTTAEEQSYSYRIADLEVGRHAFRLKQIDFDGAFEYSPEVEVVIEMADTYVLSAAYPNPFNPQTNFTLAVQRSQDVRVELYNTMGQRVATIHEGSLAANENHRFTLEAGGLPSGMYLIRIQGELFTAVERVTLLK